jgi:aminomethyltransferase
LANRTPLYDWHVAHGARMVEFAGWDMPIQYTSIIEEHQAVRTAAGIFDISHMGRLLFEGPDALDLMQKVFTNNAATMKVGQVRYGLICNEQGGILDDVLVYRWSGFGMVVNASNREKIVSWITERRGNLSVQIHDWTLKWCMVAVQGPRALPLCNALGGLERGPELGPGNLQELAYYHSGRAGFLGKLCTVSRTGYTGEDGFEFMLDADRGQALWDNLVKSGAVPCGLGARDTLRLEAGMPLYGHELSEEIDPFQAGLGWAVKMDKGDFIGRKALLRRREDKTLRQRVGLQIEGRRIARDGDMVMGDGKEIGRVTSGTFSPTLAKAIAMAYLDPAYSKEGTVCEVNVRGKAAPARMVSLPFCRRPR